MKFLRNILVLSVLLSVAPHCLVGLQQVVYPAQFEVIVFDDFYKGIAAAQVLAKYDDRFNALKKVLPLIRTSNELQRLIKVLQNNFARVNGNHDTDEWRAFTTPEAKAAYQSLLNLIQTTFKSTLMGNDVKDPNYVALEKLKNYEINVLVTLYPVRLAALQGRLAKLTAANVATDGPAFVADLKTFIADRMMGLVYDSKSDDFLPTSSFYDAQKWVAGPVFYNTVLNSSSVVSRSDLKNFVTAMSADISMKEFVAYIDRAWISGKPGLSGESTDAASERGYVKSLLLSLAAKKWCSIALLEGFDLAGAKELVLRAQANQFADDVDTNGNVIKDRSADRADLDKVIAALGQKYPYLNFESTLNGLLVKLSTLISGRRGALVSDPAAIALMNSIMNVATSWDSQLDTTVASDLRSYVSFLTKNFMNNKDFAGSSVLQKIMAIISAVNAIPGVAGSSAFGSAPTPSSSISGSSTTSGNAGSGTTSSTSQTSSSSGQTLG